MRRPSYVSLTQRLLARLDALETQVVDVVQRSGIREFDGYGGILITAARFQWAASDGPLTVDRMAALDAIRAVRERLQLLFSHPTPQITAALAEAGGLIERWLERPSAHDVDLPESVAEAEEMVRAAVGRLRDLVALRAAEGPGTLRLVPDTNALLRNPDLATYQRATGTGTYDVHILPTVLRELDQIKDRGANPEVRNKAQAFIRRLKGLRDKGSLSEGVSLTRTVTVRAEHRESDPSGQLDWLDASAPDDRILGGALELQLRHPADPILLVTSDLNLQIKADAARVAYVETPSPPAPTGAALSPTLGYRSSREAGRVRTVTLTNGGHSPARNITYRVESADEGPVQITCGPWEVDVLAVGDADVRDLVMLANRAAVIVASWEDDEQRRERRWAPN